MGYPKHEGKNGKRPKTKRVQRELDSGIQHIDVNGLDYLAESMNVLAMNVREYVGNASKGDNSLSIFTGPEGSGYHPVLIALDPCGEATKDMLAIGERIATAFERIADTMAGKK